MRMLLKARPSCHYYSIFRKALIFKRKTREWYESPYAKSEYKTSPGERNLLGPSTSAISAVKEIHIQFSGSRDQQPSLDRNNLLTIRVTAHHFSHLIVAYLRKISVISAHCSLVIIVYKNRHNRISSFFEFVCHILRNNRYRYNNPFGA